MSRSVRAMRYHKRGRLPAKVIALSVVSLIDVVFLLLLYFMCTARFDMPEEAFAVQMPSEGESAAHATEQMSVLVLRVGRIGEYGQDRWLQIDGCPVQPRNEDELLDLLQQSRVSGLIPGMAASAAVVIAPAPDAPWGQVVLGYNSIVRAGFTDIAFASSDRANN